LFVEYTLILVGNIRPIIKSVTLYIMYLCLYFPKISSVYLSKHFYISSRFVISDFLGQSSKWVNSGSNFLAIRVLV